MALISLYCVYTGRGYAKTALQPQIGLARCAFILFLLAHEASRAPPKMPVNQALVLFDLQLCCVNNRRKVIQKRRRQNNRRFLALSAIIAAFYATVSPLVRADREIWAFPR